MKIWTLLLVVALAPGLALGETVPGPSRVDSRLRYTVYNKDQVYLVKVQIGRAFFLEFAAGEEMEKWYSGDAKAWEVAKHGNVMALKPTAEDPATNLIVVTSAGRTYVMDVQLGTPPMYGIRFSYPAEDAAKSETARTKETLEIALDPERQTRRNYRYAGRGSDGLRPALMFDNGRYTFLKFTENQGWPSLYAVTADGSETLVNRTVRGNWVIIPSIGREWRLRAGDSVLFVRNDGYAPLASDNPSETAARSVWRETPVKGARK